MGRPINSVEQFARIEYKERARIYISKSTWRAAGEPDRMRVEEEVWGILLTTDTRGYKITVNNSTMPHVSAGRHEKWGMDEGRYEVEVTHGRIKIYR